MRPLKEYLFDPDPSIGGAVIPLVGMPGAGKTVAITQISMKTYNSDHVVMWRGTKQGQWLNLVANDLPVTIWNHEGIEDFKAVITGGKPGEPAEEVNLEEKDVHIKTWETADELINRLDSDRVNVINVPGLQGDTGQTDYHLYFFRHMWLNIIDALIERDWLQFVTLIMDEMGDIVPSQQQLRKPFYSLVAEMLPPKLSQLRKQNCFLYGAAHSTHDIHYFFWKIKANSIIYMSGANVKTDISPEVKQSVVSRLDRGDFVMPPKDKDHFKLPYVAEDLDWVPESNRRKFRLRWNSNAPDWLGEDGKEEQEISVEEVKSAFRRTVIKELYFDREYSIRDLADLNFLQGRSRVGDIVKELREERGE